MAIGTVTPDNLINKNITSKSRSITLITGQNLTRGAVLGQITIAAGTVTPGSNTGDGTCTGLALAAGGPAKVGSYNLECVEAITNSGRFKLVDPDGVVLSDQIIIAVSSTVTPIIAGITFTLADGATDFIVGDSFAITVIAGSLKYNLSLAAATDGSQTPMAILSEDTDASAADKTTLAYTKGGFNENSLTVGTGHTVASIREGLREKGIFLEAASPGSL